MSYTLDLTKHIVIMLRAIMYNNSIADSLFISPLADEVRNHQKNKTSKAGQFAVVGFGVIFLLCSIVGMLQYRELNYTERRTNSTTPLKHFLNTSKDAAPVYSLSSLYDVDEIKEHQKDHVLTELLEKHSKFLWVEVGVLLFAPQFSAAKLFSSPTVRMVIRHHSKGLVSNSRKFFGRAGKTIKTVYKNRDKFSTLSDYTWYVNVEDKDEPAL